MRQAARVHSIDALKDFKRALDEFRTLAGTALGEAQADVQRTLGWIEHDQLSYWQGQKKKRMARLAEAKNELFRAQVALEDGRGPTFERRAVEKAQGFLDEAETKIANVKMWRRKLEREIVLYRGHIQPLALSVAGDLPRALVRLERMIDALGKYVQIEVPRMQSERTTGESAS